MIAVRIGPDMRMAVVGAPSYFAERPRAEDAAGPDGARLHQHAPADLWRTLRLGVREGRARAEGARRRAAGVQQHRPETERGAGRARPGVPARGSGADRISPTDGSSGCSPTGARPFRATTSTIRAAGNPRRPSPCWSMRCAIADDKRKPHHAPRPRFAATRCAAASAARAQVMSSSGSSNSRSGTRQNERSIMAPFFA